MDLKKQHPRDSEVFDEFHQRFAKRVASVLRLCGLENVVKETERLNDSNRLDKSGLSLFNCDDVDDHMSVLYKLVKNLNYSSEEIQQRFFSYLFDRIPDEGNSGISYLPNGARISEVMSVTLQNRWFVPKKPVVELKPILDEITKKFPGLNFGSLTIRDTYSLNEAIHAAYGTNEYERPKDESKTFGIMLMNDQKRIETSLKKQSLKIKRGVFEKATDYVAWNLKKVRGYLKEVGERDKEMRELMRTARNLGSILTQPDDVDLVWARQNLAWNIGYFAEGFAKYSIKTYMKKRKKDIMKGVIRNEFGEYYSEIPARDIADEVGGYVKFLILENLIPEKDRFCLPEYLFRIAEQGYWFSGVSKSENDSRKAILWHI